MDRPGRRPAHPPTLLHGGFILQIGRHALIDLLSQWQTAGVNHVALGIQFSRRPAAEAIQELAEEVLPRFRRMRMCRHWIWIGRRDCESSVRTAIRMNGEQQATQHTPTLTARQGTPLHNQHPTTQATTYAETGRPRGRFLRAT